MRISRGLYRFAGYTVLGLGLGSGLATAAYAASYAVAPNIGAGIALALPNPAASPPGTNLASCSSTKHPYPVVLIPGTFANMEDDYGALAPDLANAGYCVYSINYGGTPGAFLQSLGPVPASAQQVAAFITSQARPRFPFKERDYVGGKVPVDAVYYHGERE